MRQEPAMRFRGGFLASLLMNGVTTADDLTVDKIREALKYGNASGGLCVQKMGGIPALPTKGRDRGIFKVGQEAVERDYRHVQRKNRCIYRQQKGRDDRGVLKTLVRIDSQRGRAKEGKPFGDGPAKVVAAAEGLMKQYGLQTTN